MRCLSSSAVIGFGRLLGFKPASLPLAICGALSHRIVAGVAQTSPPSCGRHWIYPPPSLGKRSQWAPEMKDATGSHSAQTVVTSHIHKIGLDSCLFITPTNTSDPAPPTWSRESQCALPQSAHWKIFARCSLAFVRNLSNVCRPQKTTNRDIVWLLPVTGNDVIPHCDVQTISCMTCNAIFYDSSIICRGESTIWIYTMCIHKIFLLWTTFVFTNTGCYDPSLSRELKDVTQIRASDWKLLPQWAIRLFRIKVRRYSYLRSYLYISVKKKRHSVEGL